MTGSTNSPDFPGTASSPIQNTIGVGPSDLDAFVTKLNPAGTAILYSTYLGSSGGDTASGIAVDPAGNAYVTGSLVGGPDFPGTAGSLIQSTMRSDRDAFVTKINTTGTAILYSTFLGSGGDDFAYGIAVDQSGNAYVTGETWESDFPGTAGSSIQNIFGGDIDAFVTKINAAGTAIVYSTYLGGQRSEYGNGIAVDQEGQVYVTGPTASPNFPGTANSPIHNSGSSFVTKLNAAGTAIVYSTYLGSNGGGIGIAIAVDDVGNAYVTGGAGPGFLGTASSPIQNTNGGDTDAYVIKLNRAGTAIVYSTYLGGSGREYGLGIAVDAAGNVYVTGQTDTPRSGFPGTASSPIQSTFGGGQTDAFVTKLNSTGTAILYSTYLGGSRSEFGSGIALDAAGNAYVSGRTSSSDFPSTAGSPLQNMLRGGFDAFVAKISSSIPFAEFDARAKLDVDDRRHHGGFKSHHRPYHDDAEGRDYRRQGDDEFKLEATFTLGGGSNGIEPLKEAMIIQVGTFSTAIPAGSFKQHKGRYVFEGRINGVHLEAVLRSLILGNDYELKVEAHGADLTGTTNPVPVSVTIGDDSGSKEITAKIK